MPKETYCQILHAEREAGPCVICKETKPRYWHISQATAKHTQLVIQLRQRNISDTDCVCQCCQKRFLKVHDLPTGKRPATNLCQIPGCGSQHNVHQTSKKVPPETLETVFSLEREAAIELCTTPFMFLCHSHYCMFTNRTTTTLCSLCLSPCNSWRNYCDASVIRTFVQEQLQSSVSIGDDNKLCNVCYQAITRYSKGPQYRDTVKSSKQHLSSLLESFQNGHSSIPLKDPHTHAIVKTMQFLGSCLMDDRSVLLEVLYDKYSDIFDYHVALVPKSMKSVCLKKNLLQLLGIIKTAVGESIICSYVSGQNRLGTLIRRSGSDVVTNLHKLHFESLREKECLKRKISSMQLSQEEAATSRQKAFYSGLVADNLQRSIVCAAQSYASETLTSSSVAALSTMTEIGKLPPFLWNFVLRSTLSVVENKELFKRADFSWEHHYLFQLHPSDTVHHKKTLRRLFICLTYLHTANDQCYTPVHIAIADIVDRFSSSSSTLFQMLSAFGITVSKSTYQRIQTSVAMEEMSKKPFLLSNNFVIASVDNIDRSSSFATVSATNEDRGFHGTSVQAVEPFSTFKETQSSTPTHASVPWGSRLIDPLTLNDYHKGSSHLPHHPPPATLYSRVPQTLTINSFHPSESEKHVLCEMKQKVFLYMFTKFVCFNENIKVTLPDLKAAVGQFFPSETQQSQVHFTSILAEPADNAETIRHVLDILHEKHGIGKHISHLVVAGDAKTYEYLLEAKRVYGEDLNWLLPYLGEWHLLKNIQAPLMKIYLDAGLRQLLSVLHKGATHVAVASASGFRKTHIFLIQSWEAMYREQMAMFCSHNVNSNEEANLTWKNLYSCVVQKIRSEGSNIFKNLSNELNALSPVISSFMKFFEIKGQADATSQFWHDFIHRDMSHYVTLFLAMRLRQFDLRNISVRNLTPIFHAMDRPTYLKLVPFHMAAMKQYPPDILEYFQKGAFSVSVTGRNGCCVAFDEAHEMLINKEVKMSMTTTGMGSLSRLVHYLPYRAQLMKTFKSEVTMSKDGIDENDSVSTFKLTEDNVKLYIDKLKNESNFFRATSTPDSVCHIFTGEVATSAVSNDLKTFYEQGEADLNAFISCVVLNTSGQKPPKRSRRNLKTFALKKKTVYKQKLELKDQRMQIASLRRQIAFSKSSNQPVQNLMQFLCLPRAICTPDQLPIKASKASSANEFQKRYPLSFSTTITSAGTETNTCYIVEGMFLINCPPLRVHGTFGEYASFLYRRWVQKSFHHFKASEIHIVFDHPHRHGLSTKDIERARRNHDVDESSYTALFPDTPCPTNNSWKKFLSVRSHKRLLVNFLSVELLRLHSCNSLAVGKLITAGGFDGERRDKAYCTQYLHADITEVPEYMSNHEEGDSRVWLHAKVTTCNHIIIYSPDRDTFHVGLPHMPNFGRKEIWVQLRAAKGDDLFLNMNTFLQNLGNDLQLQKIGIDNLSLIPSFVQVLYICSGCDFTSFFKGHSKKGFLEVFYRDCEFITGIESDGKLHDCGVSTWEKGLLAFCRLIGSVYFRKYCSAFAEESTSELLNHVNSSSNDVLTNHVLFLDAIREGHFHHISDESEWLPSFSALKLHWQRCCWVAQLWAQACSHDVAVPDFTLYGWSVKDGSISVVWDTAENIKKVDSNQKMLRQGCKCNKGCSQNWCKCKKEGRMCSLFCLCKNCKNLSVPENGTEITTLPSTTPSASVAETFDPPHVWEDSSDDSSCYSDEDIYHEEVNLPAEHEMFDDEVEL